MKNSASLGFTSLILFEPFFVYVIINNHGSHFFERVYGALNEGLRTSGGPRLILIFNLCFILRRLLTAILLITLRTFPGTQPPFFLVLSLCNLALMLTLKPYESTLQTRIELFNEVCVGLCSLMFMLMTDYVEDFEQKRMAGWGLVAITLLSFAVNTLIALGVSGYEVFVRCRGIYMRCKESRDRDRVIAIRQMEEEKVAEFLLMERPPNFEVKRHFSKSLLNRLGQQNVVQFRESYEFAAQRITSKHYTDMFSIKETTVQLPIYPRQGNVR